MRVRRGWAGLVVGVAAVTALAACGGDDGGSSSGSETDETSSSETSGETITFGYSHWPGWYPLAVAEEQGIFEDLGLDVEFEFFPDYLASLDAMAAGELDVNAQTLNDTIAPVAAGLDQTVIIVGDNSTGNDQIICDESITSIEDMAGKSIGAEAGVVDHFLLLQGLESVGMTEDDIDFRGILTADAAAAFADGEFDCVGVYAPFTDTAMERPGAHVVFDSNDFPGTIPDLFVSTNAFVDEHPDEIALLVEGWYQTLDYIEANPEESAEIMAAVAESTLEEFEAYASGTTLFSADDALAAFQDGDDTSSIIFTAELINPFLVEAGFTEEEADLSGLFRPEFTEDYAASAGS